MYTFAEQKRAERRDWNERVTALSTQVSPIGRVPSRLVNGRLHVLDPIFKVWRPV